MPELPEHYRLQVAWYQLVTGLHNPAVVCAVAAGEYREFVVEYDQTLAERMQRSAEVFLELLSTNTEPTIEGSNSTYETVRELHPEIEDTEVDIDPDEFSALQTALQQESFWKQQVLLRKSIIQNAMQGAKWGYVDGVNVVALQSRGLGKPFLKILER
jgi:predicted phage-related endonuclease